MTLLHDLVTVARSKNSSPFELTLDLFLRTAEDYERIKTHNLLTRSLIAEAFGLPEEQVKDILFFDQARAIKINLPRQFPSGSFGDSDVYGAQQHANLLGIRIRTV